MIGKGVSMADIDTPFVQKMGSIGANFVCCIFEGLTVYRMIEIK